MQDELTQAREFILLLEEAGLSEERIDYYVDKLADGTFDSAELEGELSSRSHELGELITEGSAVTDEISAYAHDEEAEIATATKSLPDDYNAEMAATVSGAQREADMMETSLSREVEGKARGRESKAIAKIRQFLKRTP